MGANLTVNPVTSEIMHHKFMLADVGTESDPLVLTGSHNWSTNATTRNDENTLIVHDAEIAELYYRAWRGIFLEPEVQDTSDTTSAFISKIDAMQHKLQPNLVKRVSDVGLIAGQSGNYSLFVLNSEGKLVFETRISSDKGALHYPLNGNLPAGMYRFVIAQKGRVEIHPFIVANE
jgi:hypothetical protein